MQWFSIQVLSGQKQKCFISFARMLVSLLAELTKYHFYISVDYEYHVIVIASVVFTITLNV